MIFSLTKRTLSYCRFLTLGWMVSFAAGAQEFNARVTVLTNQISSNSNKSNFSSLQAQLTDFINNRKWSKETFQVNERIQCNFLLNITSADDQGNSKATLTVQAARPVYNAAYQSSLLNYQDQDIAFKYIQNQQLNFTPTNVFGSDVLSNNLTAVIAFYLNYILGLDFDSFAQNSGAPYFAAAANIVNSAPSSKDVSGWTSFDGMRNRYWLSENMTNPRYSIIPQVLYRYYRDGLDHMYDDANNGRANLLAALTDLQNMNAQNPNSMFVQQFMLGKTAELAGIFKQADPAAKSSALDILSLLDPSSIEKFKASLK